MQPLDPAAAGASDEASSAAISGVLEVDVPAGPGAPRAARAALTRALGGELPPCVLGDAHLLISELVTNSVRHAGMQPGELVHVAATWADGRLRVEVADSGGREVVAREPDDHGGYGLHLIDQLATRWGAIRDGRTLVWAELEA